VEGISFCHFEDVDVVRHSLVQRIVRAYDSYGRAQQIPLELGDASIPSAGMDGSQVVEALSKPVSKPQ
jgi:phosphate starvation-inducible PhoH-like protein